MPQLPITLNYSSSGRPVLTTLAGLFLYVEAPAGE